jgi:hypothetical protein
MKRIIVFLLSFLLLVFVSISVSGNNAFAKCNTPPTYSLEVVNLICSLSTTTPMFAVVAFSSSANVSNVTVTVGEECAQAIADLSSAGLKIKDIQSVNPYVIYTLVNPVYGQ